MLDFPLILWVKLPVVDRIHPQSNMFATGVDNQCAGDSKLNDSPGAGVEWSDGEWVARQSPSLQAGSALSHTGERQRAKRSGRKESDEFCSISHVRLRHMHLHSNVSLLAG